jgi:hypothetical protein
MKTTPIIEGGGSHNWWYIMEYSQKGGLVTGTVTRVGNRLLEMFSAGQFTGCSVNFQGKDAYSADDVHRSALQLCRRCIRQNIPLLLW